MERIRKRLPSPGLIVAIIALVAATAGTSFGIAGQFGLNKLRDGAKNKTVGVGKLTYVTTTTTVPTPATTTTQVSANCPSGLKSIGGGIKVQNDANEQVNDSNLTPSGFGGTVNTDAAAAGHSIQTTVACARSRVVTGNPPS